ncbi:MAG: response regulator [Oscillospiraceae bacterium]
MPNIKRLLIVDDSEMDRQILRNILSRRFEIAEVENGYSALELLNRKTSKIDGVLLDLSMPVLDGFNVLNVMSENGIKIPVVLVTAEATAANVQRASKYDIADFISKPFDAPTVLEKVGKIFGVETDPEIVKSNDERYAGTETYSTDSYISKLTAIYDTFLKNSGLDSSHCSRVSKLTEILLIEYGLLHKAEIDVIDLKLMAKAAYFYNIGLMCIPGECFKNKNRSSSERDIYEQHTVMGAKIVRLNESSSCKNFIKECSEICMHHHERYDGKGFPHGLKGSDNLIQSQVCGFAISFDRLFNNRSSFNDMQFDFVINQLSMDKGAFSPEMFELVQKCRFEIINYYKSLEV